MNPKVPDQTGATSYVDYRPSNCKCGAKIQPHQVRCPKCGRKQTLLFEGLDRLYEDDLDGLVGTLERMAAKSPKDSMLLGQLAGAHVLKGEYEKGRDLYKRALALDPDFAEAHLNLGVILAHLGDDDSAVREFKEFIRLDVHSPRVERALRAISSIRKIPYEDALAEAGMSKKAKEQHRKSKEARARVEVTKSLPEPGSLEKTMRRGSIYIPKGKIIPKRQWGPIDIFLWLLVAVSVAAWYIWPMQVRAMIDDMVGDLENQYVFSVAVGNLPGTPVFEQEETEQAAAQDVHAIINDKPETESYLPLARNNRWEYVSYDTLDPSGAGSRENVSTMVMRVSGVANESLGIWRVLNGTETIHLTEKPNGIFSVRNPRIPWSSMITQVPYPPDIGRSARDGIQTVTVESVEVIQTELGYFRCVKLHYTLTEPEGMEWFSWYGQGVGLVKYMGKSLDNVYHVRELRSYELH